MSNNSITGYKSINLRLQLDFSSIFKGILLFIAKQHFVKKIFKR
jgi:hypothetical protein